MSNENKGNGRLVRNVLEKSGECIVLERGTEYEVVIHYNGFDKENKNGFFAIRSVGNNAHFYQFTNKMRKDPTVEDFWYKKSLEVKPGGGFLKRSIRVSNNENSEHIVVNKGTDRESKVYFNGTKGRRGIVVIKRVGENSIACHITKKDLEGNE